MESTIEVPRGASGFGMNIDSSGTVSAFSSDDSSALLAGVPLKSKIVEVSGHRVSGKAEIVQQLRDLGAAPTVSFTVQRDAAELGPRPTAPDAPVNSSKEQRKEEARLKKLEAAEEKQRKKDEKERTKALAAEEKRARKQAASEAEAAGAAPRQMKAQMVVPYFAEMESAQHVGVLQVGDTVEVLQVVADSKGKMKVQHRLGWTPLNAPSGEKVFVEVAECAGGLGPVPQGLAPVPSAEPEPEEPEVLVVKDAIAAFNERGKHGVRQMLEAGLGRLESLVERGVVGEADAAKFLSERGAPLEDDSPACVARLLRRPWGTDWVLKPTASGEMCYIPSAAAEGRVRQRPALSKQEVGEYLGEPDEFNVGVMAEWLRLDDYNGLGFDDALRMFLSRFKLPGEAQKIDRFMEAFSAEYHRANPGTFNEQDTAYTLAFSVIMLNTDHFNPRCTLPPSVVVPGCVLSNLRVRLHSIRADRKMTREQFIGNNRAIDTALTTQFLGAMFDRIISNEIKMDSIDTDDQSSIICYTNPTKHGYLEKRGPGGLGKTAFKKRWFVLKHRLLYYLEEPPALGKRPALRGFIPIEELVVDDDEDDLPAPPKGGDEEGLFRLFSNKSHYDEQGTWLVKQVKSLKKLPDGSVKTGLHDEFVFLAGSADEKQEWMEALAAQLRDPG